jgi:hypothetical protein
MSKSTCGSDWRSIGEATRVRQIHRRAHRLGGEPQSRVAKWENSNHAPTLAIWDVAQNDSPGAPACGRHISRSTKTSRATKPCRGSESMTPHAFSKLDPSLMPRIVALIIWITRAV